MESRLSWVALRNQVAQRTGLSQKDTNVLLRAGLDCMLSALQSGDSVRLGELGTFRTQQIAPRKSVDVTTGEAILLESYKRVQFTPSDSLKNLVNDTHEFHLAPGDDPIHKLGNQADEIIDILGELGQGPKAKVEDQPKEVKQEKEEPEIDLSMLLDSSKQAASKKEYRPWLTAGLTIIVFCLMLLGGYIFLQHKITQWANELQSKSEGIDDVAEAVVLYEDETSDTAEEEKVGPEGEVEPMDEALEEVASSEAKGDATHVAEAKDEGLKAAASAAKGEGVKGERKYTEFIATEQMHQDSRLAWMAYRYYGQKDLWVFIYEANKDHIAHPNHIPVGTTIRIPKLDPSWSDLSNPEVKELIFSLHEKYLQP